jgi:mannosyltransferase OCH1-like enzyme
MSKYTFGIYRKVPLHIFQYYRDVITEPMNTIKILNPEFNIFLFNDNDCAKFIKNNYPNCVYDAYKSLIPYEYKLDLWKYCVLYKYGGIYIDNNLICITKLINFIDSNFFVGEMDYYYNKLLVYSGFIITMANNPILLLAISKIISNITNNYYGITAKYPTGSGLLQPIFVKNHIKTQLVFINNIIYYNKHIIMRIDKIYDNSYTNLLWLSKNIYKCQKLLTL